MRDCVPQPQLGMTIKALPHVAQITTLATYIILINLHVRLG